MYLISAILFLHVMGAIGLFATLAIEGASIRALRAAKTFEEARSWVSLWKLLMPIGIRIEGAPSGKSVRSCDVPGPCDLDLSAGFQTWR